MKELTYQRLLELLDDESIVVQEQAFMSYRNLLHKTEDDIVTVLSEGGEPFLAKIEQKLQSNIPSIVTQTIYVLSSIASGNLKHKKQMMQDRFFLKALEILKSTDQSSCKISVLNLIINLCWKDTEGQADNKVRKQILDMNLIDMLKDMREKEKDNEVKA